MGAASSYPAESDFNFEGETSRFKYGVHCMRGRRQKMEDTFSAIADLDGTSSTSFFGVYDGHGGSDISSYCAKQFHVEVLKHPEYLDSPVNSLQSVFFRMDELIEQSDEWREKVNPGGCTSCLKNGVWPFNQWPFNTEYGSEGSTACVVLIRDNEIIVGNVGDSQCLLFVNGQTMVLTQCHVPCDVDESERIQYSGGYLISDCWKIRNPEHRAGGLVALNNPPFVTLPISRSIGDSVFKQNKSLLPKDQIVTCEPRMKTVEITEDTEFLVIASNGIWKWLTHERIVQTIRPYLLEGETDLRFICKQVCIAAANSCVMRDDMSIILVQFKKHAKSTEDKDHH